MTPEQIAHAAMRSIYRDYRGSDGKVSEVIAPVYEGILKAISQARNQALEEAAEYHEVLGRTTDDVIRSASHKVSANHLRALKHKDTQQEREG